MLKFILLILLLALSSCKIFFTGQRFHNRKKRNRSTVKTFSRVFSISFETIDKRPVSGMIKAIRNDSIFVKRMGHQTDAERFWYTGRRYCSGLSQRVFTTRKWRQVMFQDRMRFQEVTPGRILIIGGSGYILLNVINGAYPARI